MMDLREFLLGELGKELPKNEQESIKVKKESNKLIYDIALMLKTYYKLPLIALFMIPDSDPCPPEVEEYLKEKFNFFEKSWWLLSRFFVN